MAGRLPSGFASTCVFLLLVSQCAAQESRLPRVLILGDQIYQQPASEANKVLKGKVEVVFAKIEPGEVRNSASMLKDLDRLLGDEKWDLIHFNCGLGDLVHRAPGMKSFRVMARQAGGIRSTDPNEYESNLRSLTVKLKSTGSKLIWASTTPIRHSTSNVFEKGSEIEYNRIAARVMQEQGIEINDMYGHVKELIDMDRPASHGADPFFFDRKPVHTPIVSVVCRKLGVHSE